MPAIELVEVTTTTMAVATIILSMGLSPSRPHGPVRATVHGNED
jgi:hypothetical protein